MLVLSEVVARNVVNDYMSIKLSIMISFLLGLIVCWITFKVDNWS